MNNGNAAQTASAVVASALARPRPAAVAGLAARAPRAIRLRRAMDASVSRGRSRTTVR